MIDPIAGMRAMAEIQADGLRAASELLERMLGSDGDAVSASPRAPEREYTALVDAWAQILQRVAAGLAPEEAGGPTTLAVDSSGAGPLVRLVLENPGREQGATAEVWLHNGTSSAVGPLALRCAIPTASAGEVLGAEVRFDPPEIAELPPRSSRGVVISIAAGDKSPPGIYRSTIQVDGAPALWMPLEVSVGQC